MVVKLIGFRSFYHPFVGWGVKVFQKLNPEGLSLFSLLLVAVFSISWDRVLLALPPSLPTLHQLKPKSMQSASNTSASDQISQPSNWISTTSTLPYSESPSSAANTSQRTLPVACILAPVAEKHFSSLTILAALVEKFMVDQPPLYTIFDDELLKQKFCRQRAWLCKKDFFRPLSFRGILGPRTYSAAWELVMKMYLKNLNRTKDDKCPARSEGRVWQTMKKCLTSTFKGVVITRFAIYVPFFTGFQHHPQGLKMMVINQPFFVMFKGDI